MQKKIASPWNKEVKKALIDRDMTIKQLSAELGYPPTAISKLLNGRYASNEYDDIVTRINDMLGTEGNPERLDTPSEEWCKEVRKCLIDKKMTIKQLSEEIGFTRDQVSLVINGHWLQEEIVAAINKLLGIKQVV